MANCLDALSRDSRSTFRGNDSRFQWPIEAALALQQRDAAASIWGKTATPARRWFDAGKIREERLALISTRR